MRYNLFLFVFFVFISCNLEVNKKDEYLENLPEQSDSFITKKVFIEESGILKMEIESCPPEGDWVSETNMSDYSGSAYYTWRGSNFYNTPGHGILKYEFKIKNPGEYQIRIRTRRDVEGRNLNTIYPDGTNDKENDLWLRINEGNWIKVFTGFGSNWGSWYWINKYDLDGVHENAWYDFNKGVHKIEISGRSANFKIDRIHIFKSTLSNPDKDSLESEQDEVKIRQITIPARRNTEVSIQGEEFYINDQPTYKGRYWNGKKIQGLLMNARLVQGIFDDLNPVTRRRWKYPDTGYWDPDRNNLEFVNAMAEWKAHGMIAFTINMQGGSPEGYSQTQPWHNSAYYASGYLREAYMKRLEKILTRADELGMVVILGLFYNAQDRRLTNNDSVLKAIDNTIDWLFEHKYRNVLIEIANEVGWGYVHSALNTTNMSNLINRVKNITKDNHRYYTSTSFGGGKDKKIPTSDSIAASDYILVHGNGVLDQQTYNNLIQQVKEVSTYTPKPIVNNEDDNLNMTTSINNYVSWGYFDFRRQGETITGNFCEGFQSVPVNWEICSSRKQEFFNELKIITGN